MLTLSGELLFCAVLMLVCASAGLIAVRLTNPRLKGLGFLGTALGAGGTGSLLLLVEGHLPVLYTVVMADTLILAAFVLLHFAIRELLDCVPRFTEAAAILSAQAVLDVFFIYSGHTGRIIVAGVLIGIQSAATAFLLLRSAPRTIRFPAWIAASILGALAIWNAVHVLVLALGLVHADRVQQMQTVTFGAHLFSGVGCAFTFFWMTTSRLTAELDRMASTDSLTRLFNRRVFLEWCEKERDLCLKSSAPFSLLLVDLDHFKKINDTFGHRTGDEVLCLAVERMQHAVRKIDVLGRWGGEEFAVLLPGATTDTAVTVAQQIRQNIEQISLSAKLLGSDDTKRLRVTASVGLSTSTGEDRLDALLGRADLALYSAKADGRNCVRVFGSSQPHLPQPLQNRSHVVA